MSFRRLSLPIALLCVGSVLLTGCIYVPTFGRTLDGTNFSKYVGDARSRKQIRLGSSTYSEVVTMFGRPVAARPDGSALAYSWEVQNGTAIWPLWLAADPVVGRRTLVLRFDEAGVLTAREVLKDDEPFIINLDAIGNPLPKDLRGIESFRAATTYPSGRSRYPSH